MIKVLIRYGRKRWWEKEEEEEEEEEKDMYCALSGSKKIWLFYFS